MNRVSKNALYYIISNYLSAAIGLATSLVIVRLVDINTFGAFSHIRNAAAFLLPFAWFGVNSIFFRILKHKTCYLLFGFIFIGYSIASLFLAVLISSVPSLYVGHAIFDQYQLNHLIVATLIFVVLIQNYFDNLFLVTEKASIASIIIFLNSIGGVLSAVVLILSKNINFALLSIIIFNIIVYFVIGMIYRRKVISSIGFFIQGIRDRVLVRQAIDDFKIEVIFFRFYGVSNIAEILLSRIVNIYFANSGNISSLGVLSIFNQFVAILLSLGWSINNSWGINRLKMMLDRLKKKESFANIIRSYYDELLIVNFLLIAIFLISSPLWISFLSFMLKRWNLDYLLFLSIIVFVAARYVIEYLSRMMLYNCLYLKEKLGTQMLIATFVSVALIPANFFIVKNFGIYGALVTTLIPGFVVYITSELFVPEFRFIRVRTMLISFVFFAPIALGYVPNKIILSACLSLLLSLFIIGVFYLFYGKQFRSSISGIISHITFINKPVMAVIRARDFIFSKNG